MGILSVPFHIVWIFLTNILYHNYYIYANLFLLTWYYLNKYNVMIDFYL